VGLSGRCHSTQRGSRAPHRRGVRETACGSVELETVLASAIESTRDLLQLVHGPKVEFRTEVVAASWLKGVRWPGSACW